MYNYSRAEASRVPQTATKLKFMIILTLGKGNDSHIPKCSIIQKNYNLFFMFLPLNRKILTGLRHQWLIHKIKLLFLADIKNYFKLRFGVLPLNFMSPNTVLILIFPEFPNTMLEKDRRFVTASFKPVLISHSSEDAPAFATTQVTWVTWM